MKPRGRTQTIPTLNRENRSPNYVEKVRKRSYFERKVNIDVFYCSSSLNLMKQ
jgi:hypothetical protein